MLIFTIIMKKAFLIQIVFLILYLCFLNFNKVLSQTDTPFCNACDSANSKPLCHGLEIPKCPTDKGIPECRLVNDICTAVCVNEIAAEPDADFCALAMPIPISLSSSGSGSTTTLSLNPNFSGIWKGRNIKPYVNPNSLIDCVEIQNCPTKKLHCKQNEIFLPQTCTKCARCVTASKTITIKLCINDGQIKGTVNHNGILNNGTVISQTILTENVVILNLKDINSETATLTLQLIGSKKLSGTFSYGIGFDGRKTSIPNNCL